ncbi:penicillin-binding protein 1A [Leptospira sp. GIMC2001]|uniref:penicillin-binding protein 1A n=1 Tax=Leptospira sp. GIMC2001 TaxID=1513297 RepID=UPI00234A96FC|nr:PBP1A family penicillin-binding protein [Leptospira sp. GIMC2001]WCL50882.1 PBP1A family penicillin-binding protein [Leptospira sp. GIMC2001]
MKKEPIGLFSKYFIVKFRDAFAGILQNGTNINRLFLVLGILISLNILFIIANVRDFFRLDDAIKFEEPSSLYGVNTKGEYEKIAEFYKFSRVLVDLDELPAEDPPLSKDTRNRVIQCFVSSEDNDFYSHIGVDPRGIFRAFFVNLLAGRIKEGASTITQQVARLKFLSQERTISRKAREAWLAILLETHLSKEKIMESYLNEIPLGHGTIGVGAAARFYFRKELKELTWGEAAMLSSLTTRPSQFSPLVNPHESLAKVRIVFRRLVENGRMDVATAEKEYEDFLEFYQNLNRSPNDSAFSDRLNRFPYPTEYIRKKLINSLGSKKLYSGGLKIYSTINIQHQIEAEKALKATLKTQTIESNQKAFRKVDVFDDEFGAAYELISLLSDTNDFRFKISRSERTFRSFFQEELRDELSTLNFLAGAENVSDIIERNYVNQSTEDHLLPVEGSLISMRPETGHITAIVGGSGFRSDNQQIRSFQAYRQPGSSFKPILFSSVIDYFGKNPDPEKNITAASQFLDSPLQYLMEDGDEWSPENYSSEYSGFILLREALELSKNSVAVRVLEQIGLSKILPSIQELVQVNRDLPGNYSISLGSFELTPFELTTIYATFASKGKTVNPISVLFVEDGSGKIIKDFRKDFTESDRKQVISQETAFIITSMMEGVIKKGTGKGALSYGLDRPAVGKTGTTNNFRDAWFVGYTPELVASVWVGYDTGTISLGRGVTGGTIAAPTWGRFMKNALLYEPKKNFEWDDSLKVVRATICTSCGKLPGPDCRETREEYFLPKTVPTEACQEPRGLNYSNTTSVPVAPIKTQKPTTNKQKRKNLFQGDDDISF